LARELLYELDHRLEKMDGEGGLTNMLLFYCTDCKRIIGADDSESTDQIVDRLEEHLTKCPAATFTYEGTSGIARRKLGNLPSFLEDEHLVDRIRLRSPAPGFGKFH
jgi:hypothetical protein